MVPPEATGEMAVNSGCLAWRVDKVCLLQSQVLPSLSSEGGSPGGGGPAAPFQAEKGRWAREKEASGGGEAVSCLLFHVVIVGNRVLNCQACRVAEAGSAGLGPGSVIFIPGVGFSQVDFQPCLILRIPLGSF